MLRDAALIFTAMTCIVLGDTAGKALAQMGISPTFVAWARFALGALCVLPFAALKRNELRDFLNWRLILRAMVIVAGILSILTALRTEPIANVFGGFFVGPAIAYFGAALVLREKITLTRTLLLALSFVGVLLVVKPGFGMSTGMGFALLAGTFYGTYLLTTRWLAHAYRPRFLLLSQLVIGAVLLAPLALPLWPGDWGSAATPPTTKTLNLPIWGLITLSALGSAIGNYIVVIASRRMSASFIAPLIYTQLIAATLLGWIAFGDLPDPVAMIGLVTILASGLYGLRLAKGGAT
jgi:drug/metabolite transporter (DMT)-like permease